MNSRVSNQFNIHQLTAKNPYDATDSLKILTKEVAKNPHDATDSLKILTKEVDDLRQLSIRFGTNTEGMVDEWNYNTTMVTGFSDDYTIGKSLVNNFVHEPFRESFQEVLNKALGGEETSKFVLECTSKEETVLYLLVSVGSRFIGKEIAGTTITGQDMTESIKKDREMYAMARELRQLVDTANAPIFGIDILGNVNEWNNKTAEITGFSREEAMNCPLVETFIAPSHRESVRIVLEKALRETETSNYELEFQTKSGDIRHLLVNATTRRDAENKIVGVVGVAQDLTDEKKHDRGVAALATGLRQLIDTANAPIFGIDVDGNVNEWNNKTAEITGYSKEEAKNKPLVETFIDKSLQASVKEVLDNALQGKEASNYKLLVHTKSNDTRYLLVNATTRRDENGNIVGVVGVAQDVTESAEHDREMESMANELRQLIETANAPIFGIDKLGRVNEWNDKTAEITGYSKEEAVNMPLVETFIVEGSREPVQDVLNKALTGGETSNYEIRFKTKTNETRYLLVNATTRRDVKNNIIGVVGVAQDVTEVAQHDRAVAAMANELRQLVDTANAPIFGIDKMGNVNEWNNKTSEITGFSREEAFHKPLVDTFIVPSLWLSVQEVFDNALKGQGTSNYELEFRTKSNEIRYLLVNATTRRDAENNIVGVVGVAQDVTEAVKRDVAVTGIANELRQLVDTANAPIFGIDKMGNVNEWNNKTSEITGFSRDEAFHKPLVDTFIVPSLRKSVHEVLENALRGIETSNYELEFTTKSNEIRYLLVNATTRRDAENNIVGVVGVAQDVTEAAQHDRAVAAMANELRTLIDTANAPIFGIDKTGKVNEWNNKTAEITGFSKEEAMNCPLVDTFIVPLLRQSVHEVLDNALEGRGTSNYDLEFRTKSNEIRYLLVNATTRRDAENNIVGVVGVAQDVTVAEKRDRAVAAMANELRQLVDTANAPIFGIDVHGNVNEWNDKTIEITGYSKAEAHAKPLVSTFIVPSLRKSVQEVLDKALHGNETSNYELEFETKSGEIRYLLVNATTRRDPENVVVGGKFWS
jgi:PAS domain S-box-containing protein